MGLSRFVFVILLVLGCLLIGCAEAAATPEPIPTDTPAPEVAPPAETATEVPPTLAPTDTITLVPPTAIPTEEPTPEPTPTRTPRPLGTFRGCIYYKGKLVAGGIGFSTPLGGSKEEWNTEARTGCGTRKFTPGTYGVSAWTVIPEECRDVGAPCRSDIVSFEIFEGLVTEVELETSYFEGLGD